MSEDDTTAAVPAAMRRLHTGRFSQWLPTVALHSIAPSAACPPEPGWRKETAQRMRKWRASSTTSQNLRKGVRIALTGRFTPV